MANGAPLIADLVRDRAYQRELIALMTSLTVEGPDGFLREAKNDRDAFDAIVKFRRKYGLKLLDCDPLYYVIGLHRAIIRHKHFTEAARGEGQNALRARAIINYSEHWLIRRGESTALDTEFNPKPSSPRRSQIAAHQPNLLAAQKGEKK